MEQFFEKHSGDFMILTLTFLVVLSLLILVPQLLRARQKTIEMRHLERMRALEQGSPWPPADDRSTFAGRTAVLVPMVSIITAGAVTCFLIAYRSEIMFSITVVVWCVAGVISLAAVTGGVALMARLAQLQNGEAEESLGERPAEH
jgi:hypothetical protein